MTQQELNAFIAQMQMMANVASGRRDTAGNIQDPTKPQGLDYVEAYGPDRQSVQDRYAKMGQVQAYRQQQAGNAVAEMRKLQEAYGLRGPEDNQDFGQAYIAGYQDKPEIPTNGVWTVPGGDPDNPTRYAMKDGRPVGMTGDPGALGDAPVATIPGPNGGFATGELPISRAGRLNAFQEAFNNQVHNTPLPPKTPVPGPRDQAPPGYVPRLPGDPVSNPPTNPAPVTLLPASPAQQQPQQTLPSPTPQAGHQSEYPESEFFDRFNFQDSPAGKIIQGVEDWYRGLDKNYQPEWQVPQPKAPLGQAQPMTFQEELQRGYEQNYGPKGEGTNNPNAYKVGGNRQPTSDFVSAFGPPVQVAAAPRPQTFQGLPTTDLVEKLLAKMKIA